MNVLIIEGIDCSGKSTFLERLSKKLGRGIVIKNCYKPRDQETERIKSQYVRIWDMVLNSSFGPADYIFLDRFYPSQIVYSIKRGHDDFDDSWYRTFEKALKTSKLNVVLVLVTEDEKIIRERFENRGEEYVKPEEITKLQNRYLSFFDKCKLRKIKIKSTDEFEKNLMEVVRVIKSGKYKFLQR